MPRSVTVMLVDAHHHLWDPARADYPWLTDDLAAINRAFTVGDLSIETALAHIDATVLVQTRAATDETLEFLQCGPPVAGVIGWVDLTAPDISDALARLSEVPNAHRLVGIRHQVHDEPDPNWLDRSDVRRGIGAVAAAGLTFDLLVRTRELPAATRLANTMPQCRFVLDHLGKPPLIDGDGSSPMTAWATALRALGANANVTAKISGLITEAHWTTWSLMSLRPAVRVALDVFGPDRLMFGSDWPVCLVAATYAQVVDTAHVLLADLSPAEHSAVFGTNAIRTYGLNIDTSSGATKP